MKRLRSRHAIAMIVLALAIGSCSEDTRSPVEPGGDPAVPSGLMHVLDVSAPNDTFEINGALWSTTYPFGVGTGQLDPFLGVQNAPSEEGFNTDASPLPLNATRPNFTDKLPLNNVPIIEEQGQLWREFILDANEAQNTGDATFSIDRFDVWVCNDPGAPTYDTVSDFAQNSLCTRAYHIETDAPLLATSDNTSGSGSTLDYRILIPAANFGTAANNACPYNGGLNDCAYYIILHTVMGLVGGDYVTGSTFEEFSTIKRPVAPQLTLVKQVVNDNGGTSHASAWTLAATGSSLSFSGTGSPATGTTATLGPNAVTPGVEYTLSESGGAPGYAASAWVCNGGTFSAPNKITLAAGQNVTCTITNNDRPPKLTLAKTVINDNGGITIAAAWTLTATGSGGFSGAGIGISSEQAGIGPNVVTAGVEYALSESGPSGYTASAWSCTGGGTYGAPNEITLALGDSVTCVIINNDDPGSLTLVKQVVNDDGGTAGVNAFGITTDAGTPAFGAGVTNGSTTTYTSQVMPVSAGAYTLRENDIAGYTEGTWSCSPTAASNSSINQGSVTVGLGVAVTCTIINNDQQGSLTLVKQVINDDGGTAGVNAFGITTDAGTPAFGAGVPSGSTTTYTSQAMAVDAGPYTLRENDIAGYTEGTWSCSPTAASNSSINQGSVTVGNGVAVTCTIINNDQQGSLTLVKQVVNDNGGSAGVAAFGITTDAGTPAFGAGVPSGSTTTYTSQAMAVDAGPYTLRENDIAGYTEGTWSCSPTAASNSSINLGSVTVGNGVAVTCTIINNDVASANALFLVIDEDGIDNDKRYWENSGPFNAAKLKQFSTSDVNDDIPGLAQRSPLRYFQNNIGRTIWLWTGQVGDEGWFAPKTIPSSWATAGPTADGVRNLLGNPVGPGLGAGNNPEGLLDKIPDVTPLRAEGLYGLRTHTVCALVWDSDISINYGPLNGSLKGEKLGIVAFEVLDVVYLNGFSSSTLPRVQIVIRDAAQVCGGNLSLFLTAPIPSSSSVPMDIRPNYTPDNAGYQ